MTYDNAYFSGDRSKELLGPEFHVIGHEGRHGLPGDPPAPSPELAELMAIHKVAALVRKEMPGWVSQVEYAFDGPVDDELLYGAVCSQRPEPKDYPVTVLEAMEIIARWKSGGD